ncbi:hypothetical protein SNEBB_002442 [Seison nebaliae]|nr:hypothetical protein SNEBB_002442 [Seison nebaliae]
MGKNYVLMILVALFSIFQLLHAFPNKDEAVLNSNKRVEVPTNDEMLSALNRFYDNEVDSHLLEVLKQLWEEDEPHMWKRAFAALRGKRERNDEYPSNFKRAFQMMRGRRNPSIEENKRAFAALRG